jgi:ABC-2 type transport system ATP-binding protein
VIATENISKSFGNVKAVTGVSLEVKKGEIYGFLGLNGAGKTTTIRMLLGMIRPTSGAAYINGTRISPARTDIWNQVGYLVEMPFAYPDLTVKENLEIYRRLRGIRDAGRTMRVIEKLKLEEYSDRKAKHLSLGNSQRLGIAKAMIHEPGILILDEPSNGLDPAGIVEVRMLLKALSESGVTIFISSHILSEVAKIASRIGIIHRGRLVQETDFSSLDRLRGKKLAVGVREPAGAAAVLESMGHTALPGDEGILYTEDPVAVNAPETIADALVRAGYPPYLLSVEEEGLEEYFLRIIGTETGTP